MKQLLFVVSFFSFCAFTAQDSLLIHQQFFGKQESAMKVLGGWSAANLVSSPFLKTTATESWPHFHQMNFNWNLVNAGIAGLGYAGIQKRKQKYWSLSSIEKERSKLRKTLAINMGLDVCYILTGVILKSRAEKVSSENQSRNIGFGNSLILQGGFLLVFDWVFVIRIKK